ncbi:hypothetical protein [Streptomyces sp. WM4235]|nr:hypothetical protein [Streptomyces sp. WM4235]
MPSGSGPYELVRGDMPVSAGEYELRAYSTARETENGGWTR